MDYYERKKRTLEIIDRLIGKGSFTREDIQLAVLRNTFIGKKFVDDYINTGVLNGSVVIDKDTSFVSLNKGINDE